VSFTLLFCLLLVDLLLPFFCTAQQFWRPLTVCCYPVHLVCMHNEISFLRRFSAQPQINMLFASTPLLHLIIFCTQTCQHYYEHVICSIATTGSCKSVQKSLYNDTFFLTTYSTFSPPFTTPLVPSPLLYYIAVLFRYNFWYVNILFDQFKLILMTCITVADFIFAFSPITPCRSYCSTTGEVIH